MVVQALEIERMRRDASADRWGGQPFTRVDLDELFHSASLEWYGDRFHDGRRCRAPLTRAPATHARAARPCLTGHRESREAGRFVRDSHLLVGRRLCVVRKLDDGVGDRWRFEEAGRSYGGNGDAVRVHPPIGARTE